MRKIIEYDSCEYESIFIYCIFNARLTIDWVSEAEKQFSLISLLELLEWFRSRTFRLISDEFQCISCNINHGYHNNWIWYAAKRSKTLVMSKIWLSRKLHQNTCYQFKWNYQSVQSRYNVIALNNSRGFSERNKLFLLSVQ